MTISQAPTYNIKVVLNKTGIAADTLRAWERRYGLPIPQRTQGGHRLYSEYDIEIIKWLLARQAEGLSISRAVDLWNEQIASGSDPLAGIAPSASASPLAIPATAPDSTLATLRKEWVGACTDFDEIAAEQTLNQAFAIYPVETVCMGVLQQGLAQIGKLWYENRATVQQEHFASALAMRRLDALLSAAPAPTRKETILVGCPADEWHTFTPLLLSLLLRRRGYRVIYLGANVPAERFTETAKDAKVHLVLLVAQQLTSAATLQGTAHALTNKDIPVAFGGRIFNLHPSLVESIPAHFLGHSVEAALEETESLLQVRKEAAQPRPVSQEYAAALQFFKSRRAEIEITLRGLVQPLFISPENLMSGIVHLGNNIEAALQLGGMNYLSGEIEWLKTLIKAYERPMQELADFIASYAKAVQQNLNGSGRPIYEWLSAEADRLQKEK